MDPNETLRLIRATAAQIHAEDGPLSAGVRSALVVQHARDLTEYVEALDDWLTRGGFLPSAWEQGRRLTVADLPMGGCSRASVHHAHLAAGETRCENQREDLS